MKDEIWRDIKGYEGKYQVSNLGRVKSLKGTNGESRERIKKLSVKNDGYVVVNLCKDGKQKLCTVHRLVAEAFIPNPLGLPEVNHINECKQSNIVTNLEWCDRKYNTNYGTANERIKEKMGKTIYQYTKSGEFVRSYPSAREAERQTGINHESIVYVASGKPRYKSAGGYIWRYKSDC